MNIFDRIHIAGLNVIDDIEFGIAMRTSRAAGDNRKNKGKKNNAHNDIDAAEKEYPGEEPGAEKVDSKETKSTTTVSHEVTAEVSSVGEAAMTGGSGIRDDDPNVINLGFGVVIDQRKMAGEDIPVTPNPAMGFVPQGVVPNPAGVPMPGPMGFQMCTPPGDNIYLQHLEQQQMMQPSVQMQTPPAGAGRHKVDNPVPPKPPVQKAEADNVNVDLSKIQVPSNPPKQPNQWPEVVAGPLPQAEGVVQPDPVPVFDNRALTGKFKYLADIEAIALKCGVQVQMLERLGMNGLPSGLISCVVYTGQPKPNPFKGFTIDTGVIIDHRAKVFPGIVNTGFEDMQAYPVLIPKGEKEGKSKSKNVINEKLFVDLFMGGVNNLNPREGMYTPDYLELNKLVAIITMPTNNMNGEIRRAVRDRLKAAMNAGVFTKVMEIDPNSRFRFKSYDKKTQSFVLTNAGTPFRFGGPVLSTKQVEIEFGSDGKTAIKTY